MTSQNELATLRSTIDRTAQLYYGGTTQTTDSAYDKLIAQLRKLDPTDKRLTRVGPPYTAAELRTKTTHRMPMGSLDNTENGIAGFEKWYRSVIVKLGVSSADVHVSLKMDGSSIGCYYENGELAQVLTRGNGVVGDCVTSNAVKWKMLPTSLPDNFTGAVRGEVMLYKDEFAKVNRLDSTPDDEVSNPRNVGNGIVSRTDGRHSERLKLVVFNIVGTELKTLSEKLDLAQKMGFEPVQSHVLSGTVEVVISQLKKLHDDICLIRADLPFEIDGLVAIINDVDLQTSMVKDEKDAMRPPYGRAVKFATYKNTTRVTGVNNTVGHTGCIVPTITVEPVRVGGVVVRNIQLNNWNPDSSSPSAAHVKIGDLISVELAGDIVPKAVEVVETDDSNKSIEEPATCPSGTGFFWTRSTATCSFPD